MPNFSALLSTFLKSPKTALAVFLFAAAVLYAPFDQLGIKRPALMTEYEGFFVVILFLSAAILAVEILSRAWQLVKRPYYARKRKQIVEETFWSLNHEELCILWAMTQAGTRTIQGSSNNPVMLSLREKGCLKLMPGTQYLNQLHFAMPDDIFKIVAERGYDRMPDNFKKSGHFEDDIRSIIQAATAPWS